MKSSRVSTGLVGFMMGKLTRTPGVEGSTLELLVSGGERIQSIPGLLFALLLLGIAMICLSGIRNEHANENCRYELR